MPRKITESMKYTEQVLAAIDAVELVPHNFEENGTLLLDIGVECHSHFIVQARNKVDTKRYHLSDAYISLEDSCQFSLNLNLKKSKSVNAEGKHTLILTVDKVDRGLPLDATDLANILSGSFDAHAENPSKPLSSFIFTVEQAYRYRYSIMRHKLQPLIEGKNAVYIVNLLLKAHRLTWRQLVLSLSVADQRKFVEYGALLGTGFEVVESKMLPYAGVPADTCCWTPMALIKPNAVLEFNWRYSNDKKPYKGKVQSTKIKGKNLVVVCYPEHEGSYEQKMFTIPIHSVRESDDTNSIDGVFVRLV